METEKIGMEKSVAQAPQVQVPEDEASRPLPFVTGREDNGKLDNEMSLAQLALPGLPVTPEKNAVGDFLTHKLRESISIETMRSISGPYVPRGITREETKMLNAQVAQFTDAFLQLKKDQRQAEEDLQRVTHTIATLDASWKGECDLGADEYGKERQQMLSVQLQLLNTVSVLRTAGAQLAGRRVDDLAIGARQTVDDWACFNAASRYYPELKTAVNASRTPQREKKFHSDLIRCYAAAHPNPSKEAFWCPIAHAFLFGDQVAPAHVVNCNIGEKTAQALFGDDTEHIWSTKNGLFIAKVYGELLDSAKAVILPASDNPNENNFVFYLLTKDIGRQKADVLWGDDLHGRTLSFKNEFRPSRYYLYFKFALSILRRRRAEVSGFEFDVPNLPSPAKTLWASPGPRLKQPILYKLSRQLGCLSVDEAHRFWNVQGPSTISVKNDDLAATLATLSCSAVATEDAEKLFQEDDADDSASSDSDGGAAGDGWFDAEEWGD